MWIAIRTEISLTSYCEMYTSIREISAMYFLLITNKTLRIKSKLNPSSPPSTLFYLLSMSSSSRTTPTWVYTMGHSSGQVLLPLRSLHGMWPPTGHSHHFHHGLACRNLHEHVLMWMVPHGLQGDIFSTMGLSRGWGELLLHFCITSCTPDFSGCRVSLMFSHSCLPACSFCALAQQLFP